MDTLFSLNYFFMFYNKFLKVIIIFLYFHTGLLSVHQQILGLLLKRYHHLNIKHIVNEHCVKLKFSQDFVMKM